ncbi:MAG: hypothetical protein PHC86_06305 [Eubacteriales bacterium]|nr:hypothetical protein [Eubacteriales bacterium]
MNSRSRTRALSLGGLLAALSIVFLVIGAISPTADLSLLALSSLPIAIAVIELGYKRASLVYLTVSLISLAYPGIAFSYLFVLFFGIFPISKGFFEAKLPKPVAVLAKIMTANIQLLAATYLFARELVLAQAAVWGWWYIPALIVILQITIIFYDYALTLLITFYLDRLARHLHRI